MLNFFKIITKQKRNKNQIQRKQQQRLQCDKTKTFVT